ncbi:MAG: OsmC family protein [Chloroflexi bacterium]|nr:OsmC family protein [Chloroflexota bacterium]
MEANIVWKSGLAFNGKTQSGFEIPLDASMDHGGTSTGPAPMELILTGLGGCTGMDVISILQKKQQAVTKFEILLHAERSIEHPKVFTEIVLEYVVTGRSIDADAVKRAIELSETKYCSVMGMLKKSTTIRTKFTIIEA